MVNSTDVGIGVGISSGSYVTNNSTGIITTENGTGIEVSQPSDFLQFTNFGIINYNSLGLAMSLQGSSVFAGTEIFNINLGTGISNTTPASINNNACGKMLMASATFVNSGTTTNIGLLQMPNSYNFTNAGTFINNGLWNGSNGFASTDQSPTINSVTVSATGTYMIIVTNVNGCTSTATTVSVKVN